MPFLFKQWGEWGVTEDPNEMCSVPPKRRDFIGNSIGEAMIRIGKARAGRLLDGVEHNGFPGEVQ